MRKLVFDADDFRALLSRNEAALRDRLADYRAEGFEIVLRMPATVAIGNEGNRGSCLETMQTLAGFCDLIVFGGPDAWSCALHLDDKAVTPEEFLSLPYAALSALVENS